jgi:hypothetical protein
MLADEYSDPLQYLNHIERLFLGWSVVRQFRTNVPRFARGMQSSGPEAMAHIACSNALRLYAIALWLPAITGQLAKIDQVAYVFYGLVGVCVAWGVVCLLQSLKPGREYKRTRGM